MTPPEAGESTGRPAAIVLPCRDLDSTVSFFTEELGFRVDAIVPADHPAAVEISGHGLHIRLQSTGEDDPGTLRVYCDDATLAARAEKELTAPNGTRIRFLPAGPHIELPSVRAAFVVSRMGGDAVWHVGRAGMQYRDLIPGRQEGRIIASHIRIPEGGPVPDQVHYHEIHFQLIFCHKGWVRVVYEDQGSPFVLEAGDCVLQPPRIRHRVLESSAGAEVVEVSSPAEHETRMDHELVLPTPTVREDREFGGQRFLHHVASRGSQSAWRMEGFQARDTEVAAASGGVAACQVVVLDHAPSPSMVSHPAGVLFWFVRRGEFRLCLEGQAEERLAAGDAVVVPPGMPHSLRECSEDLELLEVLLPSPSVKAASGAQ
jgi:quercetin dioxygenase-like cupin family protein